MNVLLVFGKASGGVRAHVGQLANLLAANAYEVTLMGPASSLPADLDPAIIVRPLEIPSSPSLREYSLIRSLTSHVKNCDVVHAHGLRAGALSSLSLRSLKGSRIPRFVVTLHNQIPPSTLYGLMGHRLLAICAKRADYMLLVNADILDGLKGYPARRLERALIPISRLELPDTNTDTLRKELWGSHAHDYIILTVARLASQKGIPLMLAVAKNLAASASTSTPAVHWYVAGEGPLREHTEKVIAQDHLPMTLLGKRDDIGALFKAADVVVGTSPWEGQSIALQEALHARKPIVATATGGTPETLGDGAFLVPPNVDAISRAIKTVRDDASYREDLVTRADKRVSQLATADDLLEQVQRVYAAAPIS